MAIGLRGAGALATTTTNSLTISLPTGGSAPQSGDLIILHIGAGQDNPEPAYSSGLTGYTLRGSKLFLDYGPGGITQWVYWKIAGSSESNPSITINDGSDGLWGYAMVFSGVDNTTPFDLASVSQNTNTSASTFTPPSVTTQTANAWVVSLVQTSDDNTTAMQSGSEQGFTNIVSGASYESTVGLDTSFGAAYKLISSAGSVTLPTWEQVNRGPDYWAYQTIGLKDGTPSTNASAGVATSTGAANADTAKVSAAGTGAAAATSAALAATGRPGTRALPDSAAATGLGLDATATADEGAVTFNAIAATAVAAAAAAHGNITASLGFAAGRSS